MGFKKRLLPRLREENFAHKVGSLSPQNRGYTPGGKGIFMGRFPGEKFREFGGRNWDPGEI